jgi:hypothetical protein
VPRSIRVAKRPRQGSCLRAVVVRRFPPRAWRPRVALPFAIDDHLRGTSA